MSAYVNKSQSRKAVNAQDMVYLSLGHFNGRPTWHYLVVDKLKLPILINESKKGEIDLTHYGHIIFSGFGETPPEEVKCFVEKKYGANSG